MKRLPINYSSSLIGLFLELSSLPGSLVTLASFSLVLHLAALFPSYWVSKLSVSLNGKALYLTLLHSEAPPHADFFTSSCPRPRRFVPSTRIVPPCFARPSFQLGLSSRAPQDSTKRARSTCPSGRGLHSSRCTRLNCEILDIVQLRFNAASTESAQTNSFSSHARCESSEKLFSCANSAVHMLRASLKTAISCLTLQTWLMRVSSSSHGHLSLHHNKHVYHSIEDCTCGTSTVF